jgi:threonine dehydrogenase-like Zn-dependent dehydrogenase
MKALVFSRKPARYAAAMVAGSLRPGRGARYGPLSLRDVDPPELPGPEWLRLRPRLSGICGSDLATIDGRSSRYFEPIVSFPFTPGHEIVGDLEDGRRVVVIPVLHCAARGVNPPCDMCRTGRINLCERVAFGDLEPGLQCGFCESTGGGWSQDMVVHPSQVVDVPAGLTDGQAVLVEPVACAVHAARQVAEQAAPDPHDVAVIGTGALGLFTVAALRELAQPSTLFATAKHPEQRRWAKELGADVVCAPGELERAVRSATSSFVLDNGQLSSGIGAVVDCVGSEESLAQAIRVVAPGGTVRMVGMPGVTTLDLTPVWQREVALRGTYAYDAHDDRGHDFTTAIDLVQRLDLGRLVSATYPLARYEDAIDHAANAGRRGAVKVAFDLRTERRRDRT